MGSDQGTRDKSSIFQLEIDGNWKHYLLVKLFWLTCDIIDVCRGRSHAVGGAGGKR